MPRPSARPCPLQMKTFGYIPSALPDSRCFGPGSPSVPSFQLPKFDLSRLERLPADLAAALKPSAPLPRFKLPEVKLPAVELPALKAPTELSGLAEKVGALGEQLRPIPPRV